jgi:hypothetical protein
MQILLTGNCPGSRNELAGIPALLWAHILCAIFLKTSSSIITCRSGKSILHTVCKKKCGAENKAACDPERSEVGA